MSEEPSTSELEYVLGTDPRELERLRFQHEVMVSQAHDLWRRAGLRAGDVVLDLGCGPGFTSFELARFVGAEGRVIARDQSARFLAALRAERDQLGLAQVETSEGPVEELDLPADSIDAIYARWFFCWLADPGAALERAARTLRTGGVITLQEYMDWGAMRLLPADPAMDRAVEACMKSWELGEGTINVADQLVHRAERLGLSVEHFQPVSRIGLAGSMEWRWIGSFLRSYLPKLVEPGLITAAEVEDFQRAWGRHTEKRDARCLTPTLADIVLRKT